MFKVNVNGSLCCKMATSFQNVSQPATLAAVAAFVVFVCYLNKTAIIADNKKISNLNFKNTV